MKDRVHRTPLLVVLLVMLSLPALGAPKTVTFYSQWFDGGTQEYLNEVLFPEFEREMGVKVEYRNVGGSAEIITAVAGGVGPDVAIKPPEDLRMDLRPYLRTWPDRNQIPPPLWGTTHTGAIDTVPFEMELRGIAYNPEVFLQSGLEPVVPNDWGRFLTAVGKMTLKNPDGTYTRTGFRWNFTGACCLAGSEFQWFTAAAGGAITTPDERTSLFDSEPVRRTLNFLAELYGMVGDKSPGTSFGSGTAAMEQGGPWVGKGDYPFAPKVVAVQSSPSIQPVAQSFINGLSLIVTSKNPDLGWKLITYLMRPDHNTELLLRQPRQAVRRDVATRQDIEVFRRLRDWYDMVDYAGAFMGRLEQRDEVSKVIAAAYKKEIAPETALETAKRIHQAGLNEYWARQR